MWQVVTLTVGQRTAAWCCGPWVGVLVSTLWTEHSWHCHQAGGAQGGPPAETPLGSVSLVGKSQDASPTGIASPASPLLASLPPGPQDAGTSSSPLPLTHPLPGSAISAPTSSSPWPPSHSRSPASPEPCPAETPLPRDPSQPQQVHPHNTPRPLASPVPS